MARTRRKRDEVLDANRTRVHAMLLSDGTVLRNLPLCSSTYSRMYGADFVILCKVDENGREKVQVFKDRWAYSGMKFSSKTDADLFVCERVAQQKERKLSAGSANQHEPVV